MINELKVIYHNGKQYIPDLRKVKLRAPFRGRPEISTANVDEQALVDCCPLGAITSHPVRIDLGKCAFCGECAFAFPEKIKFTQDYKLASNKRENLIINEGETHPIILDKATIRKEIKKTFSKSLKLRQVSAGGDNSCENELGACGNTNFDMGRFGLEFVASPRHADGLLITGPLTENMAEPLQICYDAIPSPKIIILAGVDAISGGIFADSPALNRSFLDNHHIDLYIPGNPTHPLTIINGLLDLTR
ncbi:MAG: NADH:ubiquinone oxidoreductase [Massilibacteroides sp.]|nr:NADH:ubiquinone oxidoreductase [Massilibacteroides sp.]